LRGTRKIGGFGKMGCFIRRNVVIHRPVFAVALAVSLLSARSVPAEGGFEAEVSVRQPTRLDWEFAALTFGADAAKVPADYRSEKQRYQLFVPEDYADKKAWPLVVFISPGDDPLGWRAWRKACEGGGVFFCAAYGAGNNEPPGVRVRIVLDMLDDVRRRYRIDPEQTYFVGMGSGGQVASALAFALPELCGGAVLVGATPAPWRPGDGRLDYLRHRAQDRLSVAFVAGEKDPSRHDVEANGPPYCRDLGIRSRQWTPKGGHELPPSEAVVEIQAWLAEDLPRRRRDVEARPKLAVKPDEAPDGPAQAARLTDTAQAELVQPGRLHRGIVMLRGVQARWPKSDAARKAGALVRDIEGDARLSEVLAAQAVAEERRLLAAQARATERFGDLRAALGLYEKLAAKHADSDEGKQAADAAKRLAATLAATPYLGASFEDDGVTVQAVAPDGPAQRAGLRTGDQVTRFGTTKVASLADLRRALAGLKPGDKTTVEVRRDGRSVTVEVELTAAPRRGD
jgi:predicted esterase